MTIATTTTLVTELLIVRPTGTVRVKDVPLKIEQRRVTTTSTSRCPPLGSPSGSVGLSASPSSKPLAGTSNVGDDDRRLLLRRPA